MKIQTKILFPLTVLLLLTSSYFYFYWLPKSIELFGNEIRNQQAQSLANVSEGIIIFLQENKPDLAIDNIDYITTENPDWKEIYFYSKNNDLLFPTFEQEMPQEDENTFIISHHIFDKEYLGKLILVYDFSKTSQIIKDRNFELFSILISTVLIFYLVIGIILHFFIVRPSKMLAEASNAIVRDKDYAYELPTSQSDEIGTLIDNFSVMRDKVVSTIKEVTQSEEHSRVLAEALRKKNEDIEDIVAERTYELKRSEEKISSILKTVADGLVIINEYGIVDTFNGAAERIFGYSADEVIGKNISILMPEPDHSQHDSYLSHYKESREPHVIGIGREVTGKHKDGHTFPLYLSVSEVNFEDARFYCGILHDITEEKKAQESLKQYALDLKRSNTELDDFAYIASHDLKEPLRGIHNYANFLNDDYADKIDDDGKDLLSTIMRLSQRMEVLLDELLYFSRIGRAELAFKHIDLNKVIEEIRETIDPMMNEQNAKVKVLEPLPVIECDVVRVRELFRNLITNAIKYNDKEEKVIEIGFRKPVPKDNTPASYVFFVRDNGIGIQDKHQGLVFKIFKRLHGKTEFGGGTGSGLTICKKIVERHNGKIWIESVFGEGTTFLFTLEGLGKDGSNLLDEQGDEHEYDDDDNDNDEHP